MKPIRTLLLCIFIALTLMGCERDEPVTLTINFVTDGGTTIETMDIVIEDGYTIPTPEKDGFTFDGWYVDSALTQAFDPADYDDTNTITIYAKWTQAGSFVVTFMVDGQVYDTLSISSGPLPAFPTDPVKAPYTFEGWYLEDTYATQVTHGHNFAHAVTLYAKFSLSSTLIGAFDDVYNNEPQETTINHVLVVDKYFLGDQTAVLLYDYESYLLSVADITANIGDIITFDGTFMYSVGFPILSDYENITVLSSNNAIIKELVYPTIQDGLNALGNRPFFTILQGACTETNNPLLFYDESTQRIVDLQSDTLIVKNPSDRYASIGGLFLPMTHGNSVLYDEDIALFTVETISDQDYVNLIKTYYNQVFTNRSVSLGDTVETLFINHFFDPIVTYDVATGYESYYYDNVDQMGYSPTDQDVVFDVTITVGSVTETFPITVLLRGCTTISIADALQASSDLLYFKATVVEAAPFAAIVDDGTERIFIWISRDDAGTFTLEKGKEYVFSGSRYDLTNYNFTTWGNVMIVADVGNGPTTTYTIEPYDWGEFPDAPAQTPYAVTLTGTLGVGTQGTTTLYTVTNGDHTIVLGTTEEYNSMYDGYIDQTVTVTVFLTCHGSITLDGTEVEFYCSLLVDFVPNSTN